MEAARSSGTFVMMFCGTVGQKWPQYKGLSPTPLAVMMFYKITQCHIFISFRIRKYVRFQCKEGVTPCLAQVSPVSPPSQMHYYMHFKTPFS
jgi:hypothetical protein